ncbi:MAG: metal-sensing transcriptional repressor [Lachnospiraceae bacterium]|nr:metal-sensing transcriptional repressor [Lachnospiraceae bacterium]
MAENKKTEIDEMWDPSMGHPKSQEETAQKKALMNRMSRAIGHMESVRRMMEEDRDPTEILIQLAAVRSAISGISRVMLQDHIEKRIRDAVDDPENAESMEELNKVISYFIK